MSARSFPLRIALIAVAIGVGVSSSTLAQISDAGYSKLSRQVSDGDHVFVTTRTAGEIRGRLVHLSSDAVVVASGLQEQTILLSDIAWMEKRGDRLWNGALIGGGLLGFALMGGAGASCSPDCSSVVPRAFAAGLAIGAAVGAMIDWTIPGRTLLYGKRPDRSGGVLTPAPPAPPETRQSLASLSSEVAPGDRITVRTNTGTDVNGRFVRASGASIVVDVGNGPREIPASDVAEVRRHRGGTHVKKGLLIGIPIGALLGSSACYGGLDAPPQPSDNGAPCGVGVLLGAAGGGAVGALLGGMTFGSTVVYSVAPVASSHGIGVVASLTF